MDYTTVTIRKIVERITDGEIRIPSFQRGFVWEPEKVAFLMDSIYKEYPFGSLLFWRTREKLSTEKKLGQFKLPEPKKDYPIDYVLDGQQRITSLFTVFQNDLTPDASSDWLDIYFDFSKPDNYQDSLFIALEKENVDLKKHFPLSVLFDSIKYRDSTTGLSQDDQKRIDKLQDVFKEAKIPVVQLETEDKDQVAIVFERINRTGVPLSNYELLSAWTWSSDFDLQNELEKLSIEMQKFGFEEIVEDQDLLLKCCAGILSGLTTPKAIMEINGTRVRESFENLKNGIKSSIDFMRKELFAYNLSYIPFNSMLVPLSVFFASPKVNGVLFHEKQKKELLKWFWRSCISRRYSSGVNEAQRVDIEDLIKLRDDKEYTFADKIKISLSETFFTGNQFNTSSVNTKTFILILASNKPKSYLSGADVDLSVTLKKSSSVEFHHIFPDKHLERLGYTKDKRFQLVNYCFLNNYDNQKIKDLDPKDYKKLMDQDSYELIMQSALCPDNALEMSFDDFVLERSKKLVQYVKDNLI